VSIAVNGCGAVLSAPGVPSPRPGATVTVRNNQWADVRVYVAAGSTSHRLGLVPSMSERTFEMPRVLVLPAPVRFTAIPIAEEDGQTSKAEVVAGGEHLVFTVENAASQSSLVKR
jgi:hypothetical protein